MPSRHEYGLVYTLPSMYNRFSAVFSPRIESEHRLVDEIESHLREKCRG